MGLVRCILTFAIVFLLPESFTFSTIQFVRKPEVRLHVDGKIGSSVSVALGDFSGGELNIGGVPHVIHNAPLDYDGKQLHFVQKDSGTRECLTFFTHLRYKRLSEAD